MHFQLDADTAAFRDGSARSPPGGDDSRVRGADLPQRRRPRRRASRKDLSTKAISLRAGRPSSAARTATPGTSRCSERSSMRVDAPMYLSETTRMVASIIRRIGTPAMQDRILGGAMKGDITIALGFTEPECGSDVAAATTKAVPRPAIDWVINGSKMFTTNGHIADYVFLLARTSPEKPKAPGAHHVSGTTGLATGSRRKRCGRCPVSVRTSPSTAMSESATSGASATSMPVGRCSGLSLAGRACIRLGTTPGHGCCITPSSGPRR